MRRLWRLTKARHLGTALDGEGARLFGGRWNSPGRRAVYLSEGLSLAVLEVLVHTDVSTAPAHVALPLELPDGVPVTELAPARLPPDWRAPEAPSSTRALGDAWLAARETAFLRVPSVIIPEEFNVVLNPEHPDAGRLVRGKPAPFSFDPRLHPRR